MKQEMGFIIAGILGVALSSSVSFITGNIWTGFLIAIAVGIVYLIILDRKLIQPIENPSQKVVIRVLIGLLVLVQSFSAYVIYDRSQFMENNLDETRSSIDEGASKIYTQQALLNVFQHYYNRADRADATIASSFREVLGGQLNDDGTIDLVEPNGYQDIVFKYEVLSPDEVIITASAKIGMGENPEFVNVSNKTGKYQAVATLTSNGISYEREN